MIDVADVNFQSLLDAVPDAMLVVDGDGLIQVVNVQAMSMFGRSHDDLIGRPVEILVPARFGSIHVHHRSRYTNEPRVRPMGANLELFGLRADGTEFPVEISLSPIETQSGRFVSAAIRDVSDRRKIEQMLREKNSEIEGANQAKDRFLAGMSHELRTPLNAIIGFTGTLLMKLPGPLTHDQERQLRIVQSSARHLLSLINDMLDIAKIEAGKLEMHTEDVDVNAVASEVFVSLEAMAQQKGLAFTLTLPEDAPHVNTDRRALHQIVLNISNNAIKYTESGSVAIVVTAGAQDVAISVRDTGIGIRSEDEERLFEAFQQLDSSSTRRFEGAGLGLYLSANLARLLNASISFARNEERGSTFTVRVPRGRA